AIGADADTPRAVIDLHQLSRTGAQALAAQILNGQLEDRVAAFLADKTSGNPFFVEQLALDLRERGLLDRRTRNGATVIGFTDQSSIGEVPQGINAVLVARLDR